LAAKDKEIAAERANTLKVRQSMQVDIDKLNIRIRDSDKIIADLKSKH